jgi:hypothetical protein
MWTLRRPLVKWKGRVVPNLRRKDSKMEGLAEKKRLKL